MITFVQFKISFEILDTLRDHKVNYSKPPHPCINFLLEISVWFRWKIILHLSIVYVIGALK